MSAELESILKGLFRNGKDLSLTYYKSRGKIDIYVKPKTPNKIHNFVEVWVDGPYLTWQEKFTGDTLSILLADPDSLIVFKADVHLSCWFYDRKFYPDYSR